MLIVCNRVSVTGQERVCDFSYYYIIHTENISVPFKNIGCLSCWITQRPVTDGKSRVELTGRRAQMGELGF